MRAKRWSVFIRHCFLIASNVGVLWSLSGCVAGQSTPNVKRLLSRAEAGYVKEEMQLARAFRLGLGVPRDAVESARWTLKAANQGDPAAQTDIGYAYFTGLGVPADQHEAFRWFERAALSDFAPAERMSACC